MGISVAPFIRVSSSGLNLSYTFIGIDLIKRRWSTLISNRLTVIINLLFAGSKGRHNLVDDPKEDEGGYDHGDRAK